MMSSPSLFLSLRSSSLPAAALQLPAAARLTADDSQQLVLLLEDTQDATAAAAVRQIKQTTPTVARAYVHATIDAPAPSKTVQMLAPTAAALLLSVTPAITEQKLSAWAAQNGLNAHQVALTLDDAVLPSLNVDVVVGLERHASSWLLRSPVGLAAAVEILRHSTLPLVYAPTLSDASMDVGPVLMSLGRLSAEVDLFPRVQLLLSALETDSAHLVRQHWAAMQRRVEFRSQKKKDEAETCAKLAARPSAHVHTAAPVAPVTDSSALVVPSAPSAPVTASPALFYRASFTPAFIFYRVSIRFSPALPSVPSLLAHGALSDSLRSFLGGVGASQACFQMVDWNESTAEGIITTTAQSSVGVRAAFMLAGSYQQKICRIDVKQQSQFLTALSAGR